MNEVNYLSTKQAAEHLHLSEKTMEKWRSHGTGPRFFKFGALVRYRLSDLDAWAEQRAHPHTNV